MAILKTFLSERPAKAGMLVLIMSGLFVSCALSAADTVQDEAVFDGNNVPPWRLFVGSNSNWSVPVEGPVTTSYKSKVITVRVVDNKARDDAYQAEWNGGLGQVYWQSDTPRDFTDLAAQGGALSIMVRIDKKPKKSVDLKMDCGYPCTGSLNMTKLFKAVPEGQWFRMSLKLSCFEEAGANLGHILAPLVIATKGDFTMSFADVRLLVNPPPESLIACG